MKYEYYIERHFFFLGEKNGGGGGIIFNISQYYSVFVY